MADDLTARPVPPDHLLRLAFERTPVGMSFVGVDRTAVLTNPALSRILGYSADELRGMSIADVTHPDDRDSHLVAHQQLLDGTRDWYQIDKRYLHRDGHTVWAVLHVAAIHDEDGRVEMLVSQVYDISQRVEAHARDRWRAMHDPLTGIGNRNLLIHDLAARIDRYGAGTAPAPAVMILDLDGFKAVNDQHGHLAGDRLLQTVARYLSTNVSSDDTVGRLGGDEFMIVLSRCGNGREALAVAERLRGGLCAVLGSDPSHRAVSASFGVAVAPPTAISELIGLADSALYEAKSAGKNSAVLA
jgi:diguanylate cyclase (GGDEF)-like protein/PAS domain S-box-containing protein